MDIPAAKDLGKAPIELGMANGVIHLFVDQAKRGRGRQKYRLTLRGHALLAGPLKAECFCQFGGVRYSGALTASAPERDGFAAVTAAMLVPVEAFWQGVP